MLSEEPLEGGGLIRSPIAKGLRGIRQLTHSTATDCKGYKAKRASGFAHSYGPGEACSAILLRGSIPRTQLPCGEEPPVQFCSPTTPHLCTAQVDAMEPPPSCRDIKFHTALVPGASSNPRLFTNNGAPRVIESGPHKGALSFTPRRGETGKARFRVTMEKTVSGKITGTGGRRLLAASVPVVNEFFIEVLSVNDPPVIHELRDITLVSDAGPRLEVFATRISVEVRELLGSRIVEWRAFKSAISSAARQASASCCLCLLFFLCCTGCWNRKLHVGVGRVQHHESA